MELDTGEIAKRLDAWTREVPADALATLERCGQLSGRITVLRGAYAPHPDAVRGIRSEFALLEQDIPVLKKLFAGIQQARAAIELFKGEAIQNPHLRSAVDDFSDEHLALLDHIIRVVATSAQALPARAQVDQIRTWVRHRREALRLIRQVSQLKEAIGPPQDAIMADVERDWTRLFQQGETDENWLEGAQSQLEALRKEFPPAPAVSSVRSAQAVSVSPAPGATVSLIPLNDIQDTLAECRDLVFELRLHEEEAEIGTFERRHQALYDHPTEASIQELLAAVQAFHDRLRASAVKAKDDRLRVLRTRWASFSTIYKDLAAGQARQLVDEAAALRPETTHELIGFFRHIDNALSTIDNAVAGNRRPLNEIIDKTVKACGETIKTLRASPRTIAVEEELVKQELRLSEPGHPGGTVSDAFKDVETRLDILGQLRKLQQQNAGTQTELAAHVDKLLKIAETVKRAGDPTEAAAAENLIRQIAEQDAGVWLDTKRISLARDEKALDALLRQVKTRLTLDHHALRKQNLDWVRAIVEFVPQAAAFEAKEAPAAELDDLRSAIAVEQEAQKQIAIFAGEAALQLKQRIDSLCVQFRERLALPSFAAHPLRERAIQLLADIEAIQPLPAAVSLAEFADANGIFADGEGFFEDLDAARRRFPLEVAKLRERFVRLDAQRAATASYRPIMARRVEALVCGMERAVRGEQFEPLKFQIDYTLRLIGALEADMQLRISAETETLEQRVRAAMKISSSPRFRSQASAALEQLEAEGHLETPSDRVRKSLSRLLSRSEETMRSGL